MNVSQQLHDRGVSIWLDFIRRSFVEESGLEDRINDDYVTGVTSNPSIFADAIGETNEYDDQLRELLAENSDASPRELYESLAIRDIRNAADRLRPVYEDTDGQDGFVSLEVSPDLAHDTDGTIEEARRLWERVDRPNTLIKVPATEEGIPAIETLISEGINVNVTLMFSMKHYEEVANAYLRGLEQSSDPSRVASVASVFISRVTREVDNRLDELDDPRADKIKGWVSIANAKKIYQRYREIFFGDDFEELREKGARPQKVLWASTSTKNPDYSDVRYVEELIGPDTINTMPPETLDAFKDHGEVRGDTVTENLDDAEEQLEILEELGIDLTEVTEELQERGVKKFKDPFDELMEVLEDRRNELTSASSESETEVPIVGS